MSITDTFGVVDSEFRSVPLRNRDGHALDHMRTLSDNMYATEHLKYARGSWGYTVFRTVYTEESNHLFPIAVEKLQRYVTQWWVYYNCFAGYGERGLKREKHDRSINDEIARRFRIEVIKDPAKLDFPNIKDATSEDVKYLCDQFASWVASVGADPDHRDVYTTPRFLDFLIIDADALRSLIVLPDEIPPLRVASDIEEYRHRNPTTRAWLWFFDYQAVRDFQSGDPDLIVLDSTGHPDLGSQGWMKVGISEIEEAWFLKARRLGRDNRAVDCSECPEGSGEFWAKLQ